MIRDLISAALVALAACAVLIGLIEREADLQTRPVPAGAAGQVAALAGETEAQARALSIVHVTGR